MSSPSTKKTSPEMLRQTAIRVAKKRLCDGGPDAVKARDIAQAIGVSVGSVYNLFGQLDNLLFEVCGAVYDELHAIINTAATDSKECGDDLPRQLHRLAGAYVHFVAERPGLWAGVLAFNRRQKAQTPPWYRDKERALFCILREILAPLLEETSSVHRQLAPQALWAAVHGIMTVSVGHHGLLATEDEIFAQIELIVNSVVQSLSRKE